MAELYDTMVSPHNWMSPLGTLINAQLCAAVPNVEILEIDLDDVPWKGDLLTHPLEIEDGQLVVPDRPGWGADIVEDVVRAHPAPRRAPAVKITAIEPITCDSGIGGRDWLFVKVTTDEGIVGWGEGYDWHAAPSLAEAIRVVGRELIGQDPRRIDCIGRRLWDSGRAGVAGADEGHRRDRDRALRHQGQVARRARLRPARRAVPRPAAALLVALRVVPGDRSRGARRRAGPDRWPAGSRSSTTSSGPGSGRSRRTSSSRVWRPACRRRSTARSTGTGSTPRSTFVGALRDRVGPAMGILFDVGQEYRHGRDRPARRGRSSRSTCTGWRPRASTPTRSSTARRQTRTRICHGEALIRREQFRPFLERHVTDVVMVETLANGLSEARRICELAAHYDTMFSPHNYMSPLATLINAHLCAAMPNFEILEIDMDDVPWKWDLIDQKLEIVDGELIVPIAPGPGREHRRGGRRRAPARSVAALRIDRVEERLAGDVTTQVLDEQLRRATSRSRSTGPRRGA